MSNEIKKDDVRFDDLFSGLLQQAGTGEEALLEIASRFSRQLTAYQIKIICFIEWVNTHDMDRVVKKFLELKQYNQSSRFIQEALLNISLRKFLSEEAIKVDVKKQR